MDNNQYLLGLMTTRCRALELTIEKLAAANKAAAAEIIALKLKLPQKEKTNVIEAKHRFTKKEPDDPESAK